MHQNAASVVSPQNVLVQVWVVSVHSTFYQPVTKYFVLIILLGTDATKLCK